MNDMVEKESIEPKAYVLPLAPTDLVAIYKEKEEKEDYILHIDYTASKEKLKPEHIIIYLANTNFKASFDRVDEDLILAYIKSEFMIDSPLLTRLLVNILKQKLEYQNTETEKMLWFTFSPERTAKFIEENLELLDQLIETLAQTTPYILSKIWDNLDDTQKSCEHNLRNIINDIEVIDKPSACGPNIARYITGGYDAYLLIVETFGLSMKYNKSVFNDSPKYFGKDLYNVLCISKVTDNVIAFFPKDFFYASTLK